MVALVTAMLAYPNPYTRMNTSELIYLLFSQCGVTNQARPHLLIYHVFLLN